MKTIVVLLFVSSLAAAACPKGSVDYEGACATMPSPEESTLAPMIPTSTEKPSRHPEPAYQRGEVNALTPPSLAAQDAKADQDKADADKQGKASAGIKQTSF